jgi:hypothetical protein
MHFWQPGGFTDAQLADRIAFEERVIAEDLSFQGRFDHLGLPLAVAAECHVRSDRAGLEYRRLLRELVAEAELSGTEVTAEDARAEISPAGVEPVGVGAIRAGDDEASAMTSGWR